MPDRELADQLRLVEAVALRLGRPRITLKLALSIDGKIAMPSGEVFTGRVAFIDPTVQPKTRTVRVRVEVLNFDGKLRPGDRP